MAAGPFEGLSDKRLDALLVQVVIVSVGLKHIVKCKLVFLNVLRQVKTLPTEVSELEMHLLNLLDYQTVVSNYSEDVSIVASDLFAK